MLSFQERIQRFDEELGEARLEVIFTFSAAASIT